MLCIAGRTVGPDLARGHPSRRARMRAPQDEDLFLGAFFFFAADFTLAADLRAAVFLASGFALRDFGRLFSAARCAAANAALAHTLSSSESSNSRAGNCQ